tara:strand:+ start:18 stop:278 length:261 start_codon:yes stop_codon:yes gene_type:complete
MSYFHIWFEDALDHGTVADEFDTYEEAKECYDEWVKKGPEGYDLSVALEEVITDEDGEVDDYVYHEFCEWFTPESWNEAHPSGYPD